MGKIGDNIRRRYANRDGALPATHDDLSKLRKEMDSGFKRLDPNRTSGRQILGKTVKMARRGLADVERSLSTPNDEKRRPKISQLPGRRSDIGISRAMSLNDLKMPGLRNHSLTWAPGKRKKEV